MRVRTVRHFTMQGEANGGKQNLYNMTNKHFAPEYFKREYGHL